MTSTTVVIVNADTGSLDFFVASEEVIRRDARRVLAAAVSCSGECAEMLGGHCRGAECPYAPDVEVSA